MCAVASRNNCKLTSRWNTLVHNGCCKHFFTVMSREIHGLSQVRRAIAKLRVLDP